MKGFINYLLLLITALPFWAQAQNVATPQFSSKPFVLGTVYTIHSSILNENRDLNIYFPEGYNSDDTTKYPVVFLLDGSADEDFIHISGLYQFSAFPWVDRAPKSIIVGIVNIDRKRDFTFPTTIPEEKKSFPTTGQSGKFIEFIDAELEPFIRKNFRTNGVKTLIGESLGGLVATQILQEKPELFNQYVIVSPSLWWNDGSILNKKFDKLCEQKSDTTKIFIAVGQEGLAPTKKPHVMEVEANTLAEKLSGCTSPFLKVRFKYLGKENHGTIMHLAVMQALEFLYAKVSEN